MDLANIARLEESRLARAVSEVADEFRLIGAPTLDAGAAVAARCEPGSWLNTVVNLGMAGPVERSEIESVVEWYASRRIEPNIELCPYAHPSVAAACAALGFVVNPDIETEGVTRGFDTVLFRELLPESGNERDAAAPEGVQLQVVDPADAEKLREFADVCLSRADPHDPPAPDTARETVYRCARHPRTVSMTAVAGGKVVGAGSIEIAGEIAALWGAKVLPAFRRRGIQQALINARLKIAAARGAKVATIGSRPGIPTERNVRRMGFQVAYTKVILVKQGQGLKGVG